MQAVDFADLPGLVGTEVGVSDWLQVTQERVNLFADATGDHQWIHVDVERATREIGGPIAHGYLTLSLVIPLFNDLLEIHGISMGVNYGLDKLRFPSPVKVGSKIRLGGVVDSITDVTGGVQMVVDFTVEVEGQDKPALAARALYRQYA